MECEPYQRIRDTLQDGDVLLFRRPSSVIATLGRGDYSHAGMILRTHGRVLCLEVREWYGGRAVMLSRLVPKYPSGIDVLRHATTMAKVQAAVGAMLEKTGMPYSYSGVLWLALQKLPLVSLLVRATTGGLHGEWLVSRGSEFCSWAVADAWRQAGVEFVARMDVSKVEPSDLGRSPLLREIVRIVPQ